MRALDLNVVLQREESPADGKFDLLIATNILVYYDTFEQSLALANIQTMLRPGGILLTNNLLLELPSSKMKSGDYVSVEYSTRETDGDRILWYRRKR
jgi:2-polyprenyl-3-methyl-5-hydroxy-6-metoxy-1,4-benzoquinol methylase